MTTLTKMWMPCEDNTSNVDLLTWRLDGRWEKNIFLFKWNMKTFIFQNGNKGTSNNIMEHNMLPSMGTWKKMYANLIYRLATNVLC
jgi:hypothetical protein